MRRHVVYYFSLVTPSMTSTKFGSRYLVDRLSEGDEIWQFGSPGLAVHHCWGWWTTKYTEGCKIFVTIFSYVVWLSAIKFHTIRGIGAQQVLRDFSELWCTFPGAKIFESGYLIHLLSEHEEIWQRRGSGQTTLIPRIWGSRGTMRRHALVHCSLMH